MDLKDQLIHLERQVQVLVGRYKSLLRDHQDLLAEKERLVQELAQQKQQPLFEKPAGAPSTPETASAPKNKEIDPIETINLDTIGKTKAELIQWIDQHIVYIENCLAHFNTNSSK